MTPPPSVQAGEPCAQPGVRLDREDASERAGGKPGGAGVGLPHLLLGRADRTRQAVVLLLERDDVRPDARHGALPGGPLVRGEAALVQVREERERERGDERAGRRGARGCRSEIRVHPFRHRP